MMTLSFFSAFGGPNSLMMTLSFIKFFSLRPLSTEAIDDGTLVLFGFRRPEFVDDDTLVLQSFSASCLVLSKRKASKASGSPSVAGSFG
jgi:hypothetical protein